MYMRANSPHLLLLVLVVISGCLTDPVDRDADDEIPTVNQLPGNTSNADAGDAGSSDAGSTEQDEGSTTVPDRSDLSCMNQDLGSRFPVVESGTTDTLPDRFNDTGCGSNASRSGEWILKWEAPQDGRYVISTEGSSFDTILYALYDCQGQEIACDDDALSNNTSKIQLELRGGEIVLIVVDGYAGASGAFQLQISGVEQACDNNLDDDHDGAIDCADADCFSAECAGLGEWPDGWSALEEGMLEQVNQYRGAGATCGTVWYGPAGPLEMDEKVRLAARLHSKDMADQDYFRHDSLDGREFDDRMEDAGYRGAFPWGENIQAGSETAEDATRRLMNSPDHCENMMNPAYTVVGIGYAFNAGSYYRHYWTQDFGASH